MFQYAFLESMDTFLCNLYAIIIFNKINNSLVSSNI